MFKAILTVFQNGSNSPSLKRLIGASLLVFVSGSNAGSASQLNVFSNQFQLAHAAHDYSQIADLVNWQGVRKPMRKKIEVYTMGTFGLPIKDIEIKPVGADEYKPIELAGKRMYPNMPVTHLMRVHFEVDETDPAATGKDTAVYLLGAQEDDVKIAVYVSNASRGH